MKNKLLIVLLISFILFLLINLLNKEKIISYEVNDFMVLEEPTNVGVQITIKHNAKNYYYLFDNKKSKKVVENIELYEDNEYSCIFLSFSDGSNSSDLLCYKEGINYYFSTIENPSDILYSSYQKLIDSNKISIKINDVYNIENIDLYKVYKNNVYDKLGIALINYKGLFIIKNEKIEKINLFEQDVYDQKLKTFTDNKYIIADYNQMYDFDIFYIVNLNNGKIDKIKLKNKISFNSEIVRVEDGIIYLYDVDSKKNYKININSKESILLEKIPTNKIEMINDYEILKETNSGYYLTKNNILYKTISKSVDKIFELFTLKNKSNVKLGDDYVCWLENDEIKCYYKNNFIAVASNNEFSFNDTINYSVFEIKS